VDETARVAVTDFIQEQPLSAFPGGSLALARALGEMLGRVQALPPFPQFAEYPDLVARLWAHVCRTGLFAPRVLDVHTERLARIREFFAADPAAAVSSHNDPVPRNILFDGERLWLIDWESAFLNDPLVDAAIMLDNFAAAPELEDALLWAWLGRAPDEALRARLPPIRALTRLYYAGVLLSASAGAFGAIADNDLSVPSIPELERAINARRLRHGAPETKHILGKMFLASFLTGAAPPGLHAAS
jgi:aminoglycoside phosphotransferase (APT) family kinase protein